jgi:hypothetical protein
VYASITREFIHRLASCGEVLCYLLHLSSFFEFIFSFLHDSLVTKKNISQKTQRPPGALFFSPHRAAKKTCNQRGLTRRGTGGVLAGSATGTGAARRVPPFSARSWRRGVQRFFPSRPPERRGRTLFHHGLVSAVSDTRILKGPQAPKKGNEPPAEGHRSYTTWVPAT